MRTLIQTLVYAPENQPDRVKTIEKNIKWINTAKCDKLIINNSPWLENQIKEWSGDASVETYDNLQWCKVRNKAIDKGYDLTIMVDGDVYILGDWFDKVIKFSNDYPVFMVGSPADNILETMGDFDLCREWIGQINVIRRDAIDIVGGFDYVSLPNFWGFHDCEYGRRLKKSSLFDKFKGLYPSLRIEGVVHEHDTKYQESSVDWKNRSSGEVAEKFAQIQKDIEEGNKPLFFDYKD